MGGTYPNDGYRRSSGFQGSSGAGAYPPGSANPNPYNKGMGWSNPSPQAQSGPRWDQPGYGWKDAQRDQMSEGQWGRGAPKAPPTLEGRKTGSGQWSTVPPLGGALARASARAMARFIPGLNVAEAIIEAAYYWYQYNVDHLAPGSLGGLDTTGWTPCAQTPVPCAGKTATHQQVTFGSCLGCATSQAASVDPLGTPVPSVFTGLWLWQKTSDFLGGRYDMVQSFTRPSGGPTSIVARKTDRRHLLGSSWWPSVDPHSLPILQPATRAAPVPYRVLPRLRPSPFRSPTESSQVGPAPRPYSRRVPVVVVEPRPSPTTRPKPGTQTAPGGLWVRPTNWPHRMRPPEKGEKEKKSRGPWPAKSSLPMRAVDVLSEGVEGMNCLWNALPWDYRQAQAKKRGKPMFKMHNGKWSQPNGRDKLGDIYNGHSKINFPSAFECIMGNQQQDRVIGTSAGATAKAHYSGPAGGSRFPTIKPFAL